MTEVSWITFWQGFRGFRGCPPGGLTAPTALLRGSRPGGALPLPLHLLLPSMTPPRPRWTVGRRWAGLRRTVHGMDAVAEPPRTGSRRVLRSPAHRRNNTSTEAQRSSRPAQQTNRTKKKSAGPRRIQRPVGPARERGPADPVPAGERLATKLSTSGSASSRSRSGAPARPAAARSPAAWPAHRHSCRPSGRTPGWPWRPPRSSAACAPG
ncbi:hypothetical protein SRABI35_01024 [Stenotrophomonas lactitubi]|nr:hypothetical protein SRABI35_01024 [Stenotrophomonas lactitubi]